MYTSPSESDLSSMCTQKLQGQDNFDNIVIGLNSAAVLQVQVHLIHGPHLPLLDQQCTLRLQVSQFSAASAVCTQKLQGQDKFEDIVICL